MKGLVERAIWLKMTIDRKPQDLTAFEMSTLLLVDAEWSLQQRKIQFEQLQYLKVLCGGK